MSRKSDLIELLKKKDVIKFGEFILSSGKESDYYVNMKMAVTDPKVLDRIAEMILEKIVNDKIDKIAGPALGAVPILTAVSLKSGIPMLIVRKSKKDYGASELIVGDIEKNDLVILIEDVTTTGNSLIKAVEAIVDEGGNVKRVFVIVDRGEGAIENLKRTGIELEPLLSIEDFKS
jgi:orotate phosphoribosyltransferase